MDETHTRQGDDTRHPCEITAFCKIDVAVKTMRRGGKNRLDQRAADRRALKGSDLYVMESISMGGRYQSLVERKYADIMKGKGRTVHGLVVATMRSGVSHRQDTYDPSGKQDRHRIFLLVNRDVTLDQLWL